MIRLGKRVTKRFTKPSLTKQSFKKEVDINYLVRKYSKQAGPDFWSGLAQMQGGQYGDFSNMVDYRTSLDMVQKATGTFMKLPAKLRSSFNNDPARFLDFMNDPKNLPQMIALGLVNDPSLKKEEIPLAEPKA